MTCMLPYIDFPECVTSYSDANAWFDPITTILELLLAINIWQIWRTVLKISRNGLPKTTEAATIVLLTIIAMLDAMILLSPIGFRHGSTLRLVAIASDALRVGVVGIVVVLIITFSRQIVDTLHGCMQLPRWIVRANTISAFVYVGLSTPLIGVLMYGSIYPGMPLFALQVCDFVLYGGLLIFAVPYAIAFTYMLYSLRNEKRTFAIVFPFVFLLIAGWPACTFLCFRLYLFHSAKWEGIDGMVPFKELSDVDIAVSFQLILSAVIALLLFMVHLIVRGQLGLHWSSFPRQMTKDDDPIEWWSDAKECVIGLALALFFMMGLYIPAILPPDIIAPYMTLLTFLLGGAWTVWVEKSNRAPSDNLRDVSAATDLRRNKHAFHNLQYWQDTVFDFGLFASLAFSKESQWASGFASTTSSFAWLDNLNESVFTTSPTVRAIGLTFILCVYYAWAVVGFLMRLFPPSSKWKRIYITISSVLYVPFAMTTTRLFLRATTCDENNKLWWNGQECDSLGQHRAVVMFGVSGMIWCVCLAALQFAGVGKFSLIHFRVQNPAVSVRNCFFRFCVAFSANYLSGKLRLACDVVIVALVTAQQFWEPHMIGRAHPNGFRAGALLAALSLNIIGVLNFVLVNSRIPLVLCVIVSPSVFVCGYKIAYKRALPQSTDVKDIVVRGESMNFSEEHLPLRVLSCAVHGQVFYAFLHAHVKVPKYEGGGDGVAAKTLRTVAAVNSRLTLRALAHLTDALSTDIGVRFILDYPEHIADLQHWLMSPEHRSQAIRCVHAVSAISAVHLEIRTRMMLELLSVWRLVGGTDHRLCSTVIAKIRGNHKIVVTYGFFTGCRGVPIPGYTVWFVPHSPHLLLADPIDALLSFPPLHRLPHAGPLSMLDVPLLVIPTSAQWSATHTPCATDAAILAQFRPNIAAKLSHAVRSPTLYRRSTCVAEPMDARRSVDFAAARRTTISGFLFGGDKHTLYEAAARRRTSMASWMFVGDQAVEEGNAKAARRRTSMASWMFGGDQAVEEGNAKAARRRTSMASWMFGGEPAVEGNAKAATRRSSISNWMFGGEPAEEGNPKAATRRSSISGWIFKPSVKFHESKAVARPSTDILSRGVSLEQLDDAHLAARSSSSSSSRVTRGEPSVKFNDSDPVVRASSSSALIDRYISGEELEDSKTAGSASSDVLSRGVSLAELNDAHLAARASSSSDRVIRDEPSEPAVRASSSSAIIDRYISGEELEDSKTAGSASSDVLSRGVSLAELNDAHLAARASSSSDRVIRDEPSVKFNDTEPAARVSSSSSAIINRYISGEELEDSKTAGSASSDVLSRGVSLEELNDAHLAERASNSSDTREKPSILFDDSGPALSSSSDIIMRDKPSGAFRERETSDSSSMGSMASTASIPSLEVAPEARCDTLSGKSLEAMGVPSTPSIRFDDLGGSSCGKSASKYTIPEIAIPTSPSSERQTPKAIFRAIRKVAQFASTLRRSHVQIAPTEAPKARKSTFLKSHLLFHLGEDDEEVNEDGIPMLRLRQELTAFFAYGSIPFDDDDEDEDDEAKEDDIVKNEVE